MSTLDWSIQHAVKDSAWFTANPTHVLLLGQKVYKDDQSGLYKLGDGTTQLSSLSFLGGSTVYTGSNGITLVGNDFQFTTHNISQFTNDSGYITSAALSPYLTSATAALTYQPLDSDLTSWASITRASGFDTFVATPSSANLASLLTTKTGTGLNVFSDSPTFTTQITAPLIYGSSASGGTLIIDSTSHATKGAMTFGTASSSNIYNFNVGTSGALLSIQGYVSSTVTPAFYFNQGIPSATNFALTGGSTYTNINAPLGGINYITDGNNEFLTLKGLNNAAAAIPVTYFIPAYTGRTLSTNIPNFKVVGASIQWATGTLANQYFNSFTKNTITFVGTSTATMAANVVTDIVSGGTNATISDSAGFFNIATSLTNVTRGFGAWFQSPTGAGTNIAARFQATTNQNLWIYSSSGLTLEAINDAASANVAMRFQALSYRFAGGDITVVDTNFIFGTTTGTIHGAATNQKQSFWGATPIVQPTTGVASATRVAGATTALVTDTYDGYTVAQVVKALRNIGLLA